LTEQGVDVVSFLPRKVGELPAAILSHVQGLTLLQVDALGEALLDFTGFPNLKSSLAQQNNGA
jgi:Domain of unknown function (DUF4351)